MMIKAQTLKGFRDFLPEDAKKRQFVISTLKSVFELYGFEPLETPTLEYEEVLTGKYGDEGEKLMYKFEDNGQRKVALRYDQTIPLARVIAQYQNSIPLPFKRYQIQPVWRAENTQKGRFREFLQADADIVGSSSPLSDAECISTAVSALQKLGFVNYKILVSDRNIFSSLQLSFVNNAQVPFIFRSIDKVIKIGKEGVIRELEKEFSKDQAEEVFTAFKKTEPTENLKEIFKFLKQMGIAEDKFKFDPYLARGLDYYTSTIFEIDIEGYSAGSIAGGGRFDNLIGIFGNTQIPAVGISFGFDRLLDAMEQNNLLPKLGQVEILIAYPETASQKQAVRIASSLRQKNINANLYVGSGNLEKQLKYADKKQIPYVLIVNDNELILKDMKKREQKTVSEEQIINELKH